MLLPSEGNRKYFNATKLHELGLSGEFMSKSRVKFTLMDDLLNTIYEKPTRIMRDLKDKRTAEEAT